MVDLLKREYGYVYGVQSLGLIKVGVTQDLDRRLEAMRLDNPHGCKLVFSRKTFAPYTFERQMHMLLADKAVGREWFKATIADIEEAAERVNPFIVRRKPAKRKNGKRVAQLQSTTSNINSLDGKALPI